ncbi:MAG: hypothetical protein EBT50_05630, partial [Verrucomicrobia bacterium]|nr:hypothetical protein [Verrucomicrobiota bacterium]
AWAVGKKKKERNRSRELPVPVLAVVMAGMALLSGASQRRPHGMRGSGLSPFIFAMRVSPLLAKGAR